LVMTRGLLRVGLIGFGAMGREVVRLLEQHSKRVQITAVLVRSMPDPIPAVRVVQTLEALLESQPDIILECAGHAAVQQHAEPVLRAGVNLVVASVGALADAELEKRLRSASLSGAQWIIPSGAVGALDALAAARWAGLDRVVYTSRKPPRAWLGSPAEALLDLGSIHEATVFYTGSARDAARDYPQNANVAAAVSLAGLGFERTEVHLMADPHLQQNVHQVVAEGAFGHLEFILHANTLPENPKTSRLAPASLVETLLKAGSEVVA
jgi:aspartate dehydrogenase